MDELMTAVKKMFDATMECRQGHWQVPASAFRDVVLAAEAIDPNAFKVQEPDSE